MNNAAMNEHSCTGFSVDINFYFGGVYTYEWNCWITW